MFSSETRASLASGLPTSEAQAPSDAQGSENSAPAASLFALPRGGARHRLMKVAERGAPVVAEPAAGSAAAEDSVCPAPEPAVLCSKGNASASGFRPWYWSYEREGGESPTVAPPSPAETAPAPSADAAPAARRGRGRQALAVLAGLGVLALAAGAVRFMPARGNAPASIALTAPALPMAAPVPPAPRPAPVAALPPSPSQAASAPPHAISAAELNELMARGDQMLATGDIAAARLFYERAAESGNAAAARQTGKTYDPLFLAEVQARGLRGDPVAAARWYRKASAGGDAAADALMRRLMAKFAG